MIPRSFEYHAPQAVSEAIELMQKYGDTGRLLSGGRGRGPMNE